MTWDKILDCIFNEQDNHTDFGDLFTEAVEQKDKLKAINLVVDKYHCDFEDANNIARYCVDKEHELLGYFYAEQEEANKPHCPICNSTNLSKISNIGKAAKIGIFGIFGAGDLGKTWKCNNCGSKF